MLGFPKTTELSKIISKKAIYSTFNMNTAAKAKFDTDIKKIKIVNEISSVTTNIAKGKSINGFYVLLISLKHKDFADKTIEQIYKLIDQNILLILKHDDMFKLAVYRTKLFQSDWEPIGESAVQLKGLNLDSVWENVVMQVGNIQVDQGNSLDEQIIIDDERRKMQKQIEKLEKQARTEKQPNKKFDLVQEIRRINANLDNI